MLNRAAAPALLFSFPTIDRGSPADRRPGCHGVKHDRRNPRQDAPARPAPGTGGEDGALRRLRHAGAVPGRGAQGAPAHPRAGRSVRCLAHGPDPPGGRRCGAGPGKPGAGGHPRPAGGPAALRVVHRRAGRDPRRPDGGQPRRLPAAGGQRRLQAPGPGAPASSPGRPLQRRAAVRGACLARPPGTGGGAGAGAPGAAGGADDLHAVRPRRAARPGRAAPGPRHGRRARRSRSRLHRYSRSG
ncbi:hypothetical protein PAERUG_E5_London_17_VIM_2_12_12_04747 [Pseudomonas aeruginosa]|nr:hypothetical protein PAERUG_E5_London_17_VIM_2_12_12_04747 [Pseudomonas aeruginosa]